MIAAFTNYLISVIESSDGIELHQASYSESLIKQLRKFRDFEYQSRKQPYLLSDQNRSDNVNDVDRRSHHIWATRNGQIIGAMRATPAPYELMELAPSTLSISHDFSNYLEFSRLITRASDDVSALSRKLIACGCLYGVESHMDGVIAMCKPPQRRLFERFGLAAIPDYFVLPERNHGKYWVMNATWAAIAKVLPLLNQPLISQDLREPA